MSNRFVMSNPNTKQHYYYLNFFRALAAICVVLVHARCELFQEYSQLNVSSQNIFTQLFYFCVSFGLEGVMTLFFLSGFLVGGRNISMAQQESISIKKYCVNRISRLYPPLLGALLLSSAVKLMRGDMLNLWSIIGNLLGFQCIVPGVGDEVGVLWTIPYEIWFYVLICAFLCFLGKSGKFLWGVLLFAIAAAFLSKMEVYCVCILLFGAISYSFRTKIPRSNSLIVLMIICFCIIKCLSFLSIAGRAFQGPFSNLFDPKILFLFEGFCISIVLLRASIAVPHTRLQTIIDEFGNKLAPFSYSLFLTHFSVLRFLRIWIGRLPDVKIYGIFIYLFEIVICLLFAYCFYWLIERQTKKIEIYLCQKFKLS